MKQVIVQGTAFMLSKEEIIDLEDKCEDALLELRMEKIVETAKEFSGSNTLMEFFSK